MAQLWSRIRCRCDEFCLITIIPISICFIWDTSLMKRAWWKHQILIMRWDYVMKRRMNKPDSGYHLVTIDKVPSPLGETCFPVRGIIVNSPGVARSSKQLFCLVKNSLCRRCEGTTLYQSSCLNGACAGGHAIQGRHHLHSSCHSDRECMFWRHIQGINRLINFFFVHC